MIIGVPNEIHRKDHRVGLNPFAVSRLTRQSHTLLVETRAGDGARFSDLAYQKAGAQVVYGPEEVFRRSDIVSRVGGIAPDEMEFLKPGSIICGFHHLAVAPRRSVERLMSLEATIIGYEIIRDRQGDLPVLAPMSEMAGQLAVHLAARYLQNDAHGRGVLLGNVPGIPPPTVLILGAGSVGLAAARKALASGAHVIVLDADLRKLRLLSRELSGQAVTAVAGTERLEKYTAIADVLIGAILIPGARAPFLVTEAMVRAMKPGSVIIDISIDQGGCVETSRPTTIDNPTFVLHDVVHYCVPNLTANIARTATRALGNAALPYVIDLAGKGLDAALRDDPGLAAGVYLYRGNMVNERAGETLGMPATPLGRLLERGRA